MAPLFSPAVSICKKLCCAALCAAVLFCAGCGQHPASVPAGDVPAAETLAPVPETSSRKPLSQITAISPASIPTFAGLGNGRVLSCWTDFNDTGDEEHTYLDVIDLETDQVVCSAEMEGYAALERVFSDNTALLHSYEQDCFFFLDEELNRTRVEVPDADGQFSRDHSRYFFMEEEVLYELDLSTGERSPVELAPGIRLNWISGIHPDQDYLFGWISTSLYSYDTCGAVIDCHSGQALLAQEGLGSPVYYEDSFQARVQDYDSGEDLLIWGKLAGDAPLQGVRFSGMGSQYSYTESVLGSNYVLLCYDSAMTDEGEATTGSRGTKLYRLEEEGLSVCDLADYGFADTLAQPVFLPEEGLILSGNYQDNGCSITLIDPQQLTFVPADAEPVEAPERIDRELLDRCAAELIWPEVAPELEQLRQRADELETRYDIHILLSNQCAAPCGVSGYRVTTTDQSGWENEPATLTRALDQLEFVLENYPEDFFSQFQSGLEDSGVYFMPVGSIESDFQMGIAAFELGMGTREYIAYDCSFYELTSNLYHEIWHATENKITHSEYTAFYDGSWDACNPEEFAYLYSYDYYSGEEASGQWTYFSGGGEVCFVDDYSYTYPWEDRARIMEYVMGDDAVAQNLLESPVIRQKLRLMSDGIRAAFDTSGWENVRWERFLS